MSIATSPVIRPSATRSALERSIGNASGWHVAIIALVAFAAELAVLAPKDVLILEWRPTDLAAIALNFYRHGFHLLHPQILWGGNGPGYVEMEFPLIPYSIALLYAVFGVHDWVALAVPMLFGVGLALVLNACTKHFFGPSAGFVAGLFVATSPTWLTMSTGVWPDAPPVFCGTLGLYLLARWVEDNASWRLIVAALAMALAILLKLTSLYLGLPVAFLFWVRYRGRLWRAWQVWTCGVLVLLPPALWYVHAYRLFLEYHNTFGIIASGYLKFGDVGTLTDPRFYAKTFARVVLFHTTPLGFVLVAIGIVGRPARAVQYLFHVWLGAVLFYFLVAAAGVNLGHYAYALPIVPPAAAFAGIGLVTLSRMFDSRQWVPFAVSNRMAALVLVALVGANSAAANYLFETRGMRFNRVSVEKRKTGVALSRLTTPDDLILVVDAAMDDRTPETSMTPPEVFYFSDRRGWYRSMAWLTPENIEDLRAEGARALAVSANDVDYFRDHYAALYKTCASRYRTLMDGDDGIIYDLTRRLDARIAR